MSKTPGYLTLEDGSRFPRPALESDEHHSPAHAVAWYGAQSLTREQALWLASCADAFGYLVSNPEQARRKVPMIRRALARESADLVKGSAKLRGNSGDTDGTENHTDGRSEQ